VRQSYVQSNRYCDAPCCLPPPLRSPSLLCGPLSPPDVDRGVWLWLMGRLSIGCFAIVRPLIRSQRPRWLRLSPWACASPVRHSQTRLLMKGTPLFATHIQSSFAADTRGATLHRESLHCVPCLAASHISIDKYILTVACNAFRIGQVTSLVHQ